MFPSFVAAAAAACLTLCIPGSDRISGASAFHLQGGSPKLALGFEAPHSAQRAAALATPSSSPSSLLSVGPHKEALAGTQQLAAAFSQQECSKLDEGDSSALALAAFSRCHKPLLNDRGPEIPDGNLCMLLRGCDAHQRMISPLELKTNAAALPGAAPALVMAAKGQAAVDRLCEQMVEDLRTAEKQCRGLPLVDLLKLEVSKVHRLLQYATAAGLKKNFLNTHALQVMLELYEVQTTHVCVYPSPRGTRCFAWHSAIACAAVGLCLYVAVGLPLSCGCRSLSSLSLFLSLSARVCVFCIFSSASVFEASVSLIGSRLGFVCVSGSRSRQQLRAEGVARPQGFLQSRQKRHKPVLLSEELLSSCAASAQTAEGSLFVSGRDGCRGIPRVLLAGLRGGHSAIS